MSKIVALGLLGSSVWGVGIHADHNGVSVTHQEWVDPEPSSDSDKPTYLPHGHYYSITAGENTTDIHFQNGPVKEHGVNGITSEALLAIIIHRTKKHRYGHIAGFTGSQWVSDFRQRSHDVYRDNSVTYQYYRL